jgi:NAD(P)-dependent dehydrogenase (short-subunit alcohol dehydrogenase family)
LTAHEDAGSGVAIVTGGGSGIGRAAALALVRAGYRVTISGRRPGPLDETVRLAGNLGNQLYAVPSDVTDQTAVQGLFEATMAVFGRMDVLFNNAGAWAPSTPLEDLAFRHWKRALDTNLTGTFLCIQEAFRHMKRQDPKGGRIINNGSISAHSPRPNSIAYTASKHGITGLTKSAALDGRSFNIAVSQIDIGNARTEATAGVGRGVLQADGRVIAESLIEVACVAEAVVYLAGLPLQANVPFMTLMATQMPFLGRG